MTARASLAHIITRVRLLVNDQGGTPVFTDDQIQETLDMRRIDVRYYELTPTPTIQGPPTAGTVSFLDFYAPDYTGWWEEDEQILSNVWAAVTPATADRIVGHWTVTTNLFPPVYIVGKNHDLYAAAADTLEQWIALLKLQYDTVHERDRFLRNQRITAMEGMIATYRAKQRVQSGDLMRPDTTTGYDLNWNSRPFTLR
jgi:hypothetical protein